MVVICGIVAVTSDRDVVPASSGASSVELTTAAGFGRMLDDIEHQLGSGEVDRLIVYPEYASISRAVVGAPGSEQSYRYEDGHLTDNGRRPGVLRVCPSTSRSSARTSPGSWVCCTAPTARWV